MAFDQSSPLGVAITSATRIAFKEGFDLVPTEARAIFNTEYVNTLYKIYDSFVMDRFASSTGFGGNYKSSLPTKGDTKTFTQGKVTDSFEIIKEIEGFANASNGYGVVAGLQKAMGIGKSAAKRVELDCSLDIGFGAGTAYTDIDGSSIATLASDGLAHFSASHTVQGSASTYSNLGSLAFGQTGLEASELRFRKMINHDGQQIVRRPDTIYSTKNPTTVNLIQEYNKGMNHIEDMNRGINVYMGKYDHVALQYLDSDNSGAVDTSKAAYWGLCVRGDDQLKLLISQDPQVYPPEMVLRNRNILVQTDAVYAHGMMDPNSIDLSVA